MHVATPGGQQVPWASRFCETNVRTYVRDRQGRAGIWFFSLEATSRQAVEAALYKKYGDLYSAFEDIVVNGRDAVEELGLPKKSVENGRAVLSKGVVAAGI